MEVIMGAAELLHGSEGQHQYSCTSLFVSDYSNITGKLHSNEIVSFLLKFWFLYVSDDGMSAVRFRYVRQLLEYQVDGRLISIMKSISCLRTVVQAQNDTEASQVIDLVKEFRVAQKDLIITIPNWNVNYLQNKTINFKVIIKHQAAGDTRCWRFKMQTNYLSRQAANLSPHIFALFWANFMQSSIMDHAQVWCKNHMEKK